MRGQSSKGMVGYSYAVGCTVYTAHEGQEEVLDVAKNNHEREQFGSR